MTMNQELSIECGGVAFETNMLSRTIYVAPCHVPEALGAILEAMEVMADDSTLCQALADHPDFCELAAQVAVIRKLQRELDERTATDADHGILNELRRSANPWIHREAGNLLVLIADERDQVAAHDGAEDFEPELRTFESRGVTVEDHGRLNYIRANAKGAQRDRAGALLVKLAGVAK